MTAANIKLVKTDRISILTAKRQLYPKARTIRQNRNIFVVFVKNLALFVLKILKETKAPHPPPEH